MFFFFSLQPKSCTVVQKNVRCSWRNQVKEALKSFKSEVICSKIVETFYLIQSCVLFMKHFFANKIIFLANTYIF